MASHIVIVILLVSGIALITCSIVVLRRKQREHKEMVSLMYFVTHEEISNPLQCAMAALVNLERDVAHENGVVQRDVQSLIVALTRLTDVVRNLRALVILDIPDSRRTRGYVNVVELVKNVIVETAQLDSVGITYHGEDQCLRTFAYEPDIRRLFAILIGSAIRYSRGCPLAHIIVTITHSRKFIQICISDNVVRETPARLGWPWDMPSRSASATADIAGNGLECYLATQIATRYGYKFDVIDEIGPGISMTIEIPKVPDSVAER